MEWARAEVSRLQALLPNVVAADARSGYGTSRLRHAHTSQALEFLRRVAPGSAFLDHAESELAGAPEDNLAVAAVAANLANWIEFAEAGMATALPYATQARLDAATDLMEQVQALLNDPKVVPAAPVMLAGAALEEFLRSLLATTTETVSGSATLAKYAAALRRGDVLTANDEKDVIAMAGTRNDAAHGNFEMISPERARLMADQVNLFIRQRTPTV